MEKENFPNPDMRILVIEDNPINALVFVRYFELEWDLKITVVDSGRDGITLAEEMNPHLIILDMRLPDMHGKDVIRIIRGREELRHLKVIAVSAEAFEDDIEAALAAGVDDYLTKPYEHKEFETLLVRHLMVRD